MFVRNPFGKDPLARLYKTGDLARYLPDGNIEFLGRFDHQIKIRGFRIEPGEIETILSQHQAVQESVVLASEDTGDKRLVGYIVPNGEEAPKISELRRFLTEKLPDYMVPSVFVKLDTLPLTPNGKVDRRALPAPDQSDIEAGVKYVAPRTPVEETLVEIWAKVLKIEKVGVYDNFFELGGHSLLVTQVISQLRDTLRVELTVRDFFEAPTVARLSDTIQQAGQMIQKPKMLPRERKIQDRLPLSFAQQRLWFLDQMEPGNIAYNFNYAYRLRGLLDLDVLESSLYEMVRRHEILRTTFAVQEGEPVQVINSAASLSLRKEDLSDLSRAEQGERSEQIVVDEWRYSFDLEQGPLMRTTLLKLGEDEYIFLLAMHHIITDGWSMGIFFQELSEIYKAFSSGNSSPLPGPPIQYADFSIWQREWLQGEVLENQVAYWKQHLEGAPPILELLTDRPRPAVQSSRGSRCSIGLSSTLSRAIKDLTQRENATLFMTMLAAFQLLLYRYTGQEDIVIGSPIANRNQRGIEGLIGFFVNTLVFRTRLADDLSFRELLGQVRETALGAYAHQDLPFEKLVEELQPERDLSHTPLFQVLFNMLNLEGEGFT